ncbi:MAG: hypothetical protein LAO78_04105 [Acidobacteriia bacterium]|nr:hypothetical protein [Terriglobia bacterium]
MAKSICASLLLGVLASAQSIPPGQLRTTAVAAGTSADKDVCGLPHFYLPLWKADSNTVQCFYGTENAVDAINQVKFLYGFGGGDSKTLSSDLVSIQFPGGLQATLGQSVTMGTSTTSTVTTTITPPSGPPQQTTSTLTTDTPSTAISKIEQGGDLFVRFAYPLIYRNRTHWGGMIFAVPRLAGNFSGFGSEATITQANEYNFNISVESYGEWRALEQGGLMYADIRTGLQYIQPEVAQQLGLGSQNKFLLTQFAAGIEFAKLLRFGFQRFIGPTGAFGVTQNELSKWHLVISLVPRSKG